MEYTGSGIMGSETRFKKKCLDKKKTSEVESNFYFRKISFLR